MRRNIAIASFDGWKSVQSVRRDGARARFKCDPSESRVNSTTQFPSPSTRWRSSAVSPRKSAASPTRQRRHACAGSGDEAFDRAGAVAELFGGYADAAKHRQPHIAEGGLVREHDLMTELDPGTTVPATFSGPDVAGHDRPGLRFFPRAGHDRPAVGKHGE